MTKKGTIVSLNKNIQLLKFKGKIKSNADIARDLGYSKSVVNGYITGSSKISDQFISKFEKFYGLIVNDTIEYDKVASLMLNNDHELYASSNEIVNKQQQEIENLHFNYQSKIADKQEIIDLLKDKNVSLMKEIHELKEQLRESQFNLSKSKAS